ncbi:MAG TPA: S41 family peptidase [Candidatus Obscuribacterales bacterium]
MRTVRALVTALILSGLLGGPLLCFFVSPSPAATPQPLPSAPLRPEQIYRKVWELIRDSYYDPTYNGQSWSYWEHRYDGKLKTLDDAHKAVETMLVSLGDRYTRFLDRTAFEEEKQQIAARLYGIGIQMGMDKTQRIVVIAPIEGSPAAQAGIMSGDEIAEIDGKPTKGLSLEEASRSIRGQAGTKVTLTIIRNNERKQFTITRAEIPIKSVHVVKMLNNDVGYIRLGTFMSEVANQEMRDALAKLTPARGLILDLRGNPGGLVTNAVDICGMFLEGGIVVSTVDRNGNPVPSRCVGRPISRQPLVVLIDQGSASASEITAGALRDTGRAELVGEKSFGKGLVQAINKLEDGSGVNITIARYVTPNNTDINKKGIVPDYQVELKAEDYQQGKGPWWADPSGPTAKRSPDDMKDVQLKKAVEVLEKRIQSSQPAYEIKLNVPIGSMWQ